MASEVLARPSRRKEPGMRPAAADALQRRRSAGRSQTVSRVLSPTVVADRTVVESSRVGQGGTRPAWRDVSFEKRTVRAPKAAVIEEIIASAAMMSGNHHGAFLLGLLVSRSTSASDRSPRIALRRPSKTGSRKPLVLPGGRMAPARLRYREAGHGPKESAAQARRSMSEQ